MPSGVPRGGRLIKASNNGGVDQAPPLLFLGRTLRGVCLSLRGGYPSFMGLWLPIALLALVVGLAPETFAESLSEAQGHTKTALLAQTNAWSDRVASAHAHYAAGVVAELEGWYDQASEEFDQATQLDGDNEPLALEVSQRFLTRLQPQKALVILERFTNQPNATADVFNQLSYIYARLDRLENAIQADKRVVEKSPGDLAGYQHLYFNYLKLNQPERAYAVLEQAAKVPDATGEFLVKLAELFSNCAQQTPSQRLNANAAALETLKRAVKNKEMSTGLRLKLADGFNLLRERAAAKKIYLGLLDDAASPTQMRPIIHARLVEIFVMEGDRERAMQQLQAILKADPTNLAANMQLGDLAWWEEKYQLAADSYRKVVLLRPDLEPPYYQLAQANLALNQAADALEVLRQARLRFDAGYAAELLAGIACERLKHFDEAVGHFSAAEVLGSASNPSRVNRKFYYQFGVLFENMGDSAQAERQMRKSLELSPDFAEAQNFLGYLWAEQGTNLVAARRYIEQAVKAEPKNPAFLDSLAWVLFKLGRTKEALPPLLKAVELIDAPDATLYDHLGEIYSALNQMDKARAAWTKSLSVETNDAIRLKLDSTPAR